MEYDQLMECLDQIEELAENLYFDVTDLKVMVSEAECRNVKVDFKDFIKNVGRGNDCHKMLVKINVLILKLKIEFLEKGVHLSNEEYLQWLLEMKKSEV